MARRHDDMIVTSSPIRPVSFISSLYPLLTWHVMSGMPVCWKYWYTPTSSPPSQLPAMSCAQFRMTWMEGIRAGPACDSDMASNAQTRTNRNREGRSSAG